jgi:hypothetical protein
MQHGPPFSVDPFTLNTAKPSLSADSLPTSHFSLPTFQHVPLASSPRRLVCARGAHLALARPALINGVIIPLARSARVISPPANYNDCPCLFLASSHPFLYFCVRARYRAETFRGKHCMPFCAPGIRSVYRATTGLLLLAISAHHWLNPRIS